MTMVGGGTDRAPTNPPPWGRDLVRPAPLAAVALLVLNDHVFKRMVSAPTSLTGKLSDLAGLFFFPVLLVALVEAVRAVARRPLAHPPPSGAGTATVAAVVTAVVFACFELMPSLAKAVRPWMVTTPDPTDLLALPMVALSWWWLRRQASPTAPGDRNRPGGHASPGRFWRLAGVIAAAAASVATSQTPTPPLPPPPLWMIGGRPIGRAGCAEVEPWISKSGRQGVGATLRLRAVQEGCVVTLSSAALIVAGAEHRAASLPAAVTVTTKGPSHMYLAFAFDNLRAWKDQKNSGELVLTFADADRSQPGVAATLRYPMIQWQPPTPAWAVSGPTREWSCSRVELVISGGEPDRLTATLRLQPTSTSSGCTLTITGARFHNEGAMTEAAELPVPLTLTNDRVATVELEFRPVRPPARAASRLVVELDNQAGQSTSLEWSLSPFPPPDRANTLPTSSGRSDGGESKEAAP